MLAGLLAASHLCAPDDVPDLVAVHAATAGLRDPMVYLADLVQQLLVPMSGEGEPLGIDGTVGGRAYRGIEVLVSGTEPDDVIWLPLLDGTERLGVLRVTVAEPDARAHEWAQSLASLVSLIVVSKRPYGDSYARIVRRKEMSLSAELQWMLLPPRTFAHDRLVISGALEPAYEIGGDAFDYALAGTVAHLAIFDAMGHDLAAGLTAAIAMACNRNCRRAGHGMAETTEAIDHAVADQFGGSRFVTGLIARLDTDTGVLSWVCRGHPPPLLVRNGRWASTLECRSGTPMGMRLGAAPEPTRYQLEPGDRVLFYSDGVVEARDEQNQEFGLERFTDLVIRNESDGLSAPETLRRLVGAILEHQGGRLQDDATVLIAEWRTDARRQFASAL